MTEAQKTLLLIVIPSGILLILSYIFCIGDNADIMWGGISKGYRTVYLVSILLSTVCFFVSFSYIFSNILSGGISLPFSLDTRIVHITYTILLISSILWTPLVRVMVDNPSDIVWFFVRAVLMITGISFFSLFVLLLKIPLQEKNTYYILSVVSSFILFFHTFVLDALIWPYFWNR